MIAIWGANGFIGRHLVNNLAADNAQITLFSRGFEGFPYLLPAGVLSYEYDFAQPPRYIDHVQDCRVAILLVSASQARTFADNPDKEIEYNVKPYQAFFDAIAAQDNVLEQIIYISSGGAIYGDVSGNAPISENHDAAPISPYGKGKLAIEQFLINTGLNYTILRVANPVGQWGRGLVNAALNAAQSGETLNILGDDATIRDYFAVEELAGSIAAVIDNPHAKNQIFNVGSGAGHSIMDVIDIVQNITGKQINIEKQSAPITDISYNVLDCSKIKDKIGWSAGKTLEAIISDMWNNK